MGLIEQSRIDAQAYTSQDWGVTMTLIDTSLNEIELSGLHTKHHMSIDFNTGKFVNARNAHITFSEANLVDFSVRDFKGIVNMSGYKVKVSDSTGTEWTYIIREWFPDETLGTITCILGDYE